MAGHSKWKNIKYKKAAADTIKMRKFTKLSKEITVAAKLGADPSSNPTLRMLIEKANAINMPKENYLRAIKKSQGVDKVIYESAYYQGYGPCNVAIIVEVLSDNKNRAAAEIRRIFHHNGGRIGEPGSVEWMFIKCGIIEGTTLYHNNEEELLEELLNFDIYDLFFDNTEFSLIINMLNLIECKEKLKKIQCIINDSYIGYHPIEKLTLNNEENEKISEFIEILEENEDIQNIFLNI
jgi:YebC/PmpR family DNA-binding regulatory protein